jgi:hypothetical protein
MPVPESFYTISARLTELLGSYKYAEARALILNGPTLEPSLVDYFLARIEYHETYLGPFAPRKKSGGQ